MCVFVCVLDLRMCSHVCERERESESNARRTYSKINNREKDREKEKDRVIGTDRKRTSTGVNVLHTLIVSSGNR